jgi:hypothetical protein
LAFLSFFLIAERRRSDQAATKFRYGDSSVFGKFLINPNDDPAANAGFQRRVASAPTPCKGMADEEKIGKPWNDDELDAIVADYFSMLRAELYLGSRISNLIIALSSCNRSDERIDL